MNEGSTATLAAILKSDTGAILGADDLSSLTVTLYDERSGAVINGCSDRNILGQNGGEFDGNEFKLTLSSDDLTIPGPHRVQNQNFVLFFKWTYNGGAKAGKQEIVLSVKNFLKG